MLDLRQRATACGEPPEPTIGRSTSAGHSDGTNRLYLTDTMHPWPDKCMSRCRDRSASRTQRRDPRRHLESQTQTNFEATMKVTETRALLPSALMLLLAGRAAAAGCAGACGAWADECRAAWGKWNGGAGCGAALETCACTASGAACGARLDADPAATETLRAGGLETTAAAAFAEYCESVRGLSSTATADKESEAICAFLAFTMAGSINVVLEAAQCPPLGEVVVPPAQAPTAQSAAPLSPGAVVGIAMAVGAAAVAAGIGIAAVVASHAAPGAVAAATAAAKPLPAPGGAPQAAPEIKIDDVMNLAQGVTEAARPGPEIKVDDALSFAQGVSEAARTPASAPAHQPSGPEIKIDDAMGLVEGISNAANACPGCGKVVPHAPSAHPPSASTQPTKVPPTPEVKIDDAMRFIEGASEAAKGFPPRHQSLPPGGPKPSPAKSPGP
ncbi:hypothetical protein DFJ74DRAFT_734243 [Hyaloraphidium curvatum]|nr:hypothetical protein DFJ74DRAFT_734243 [Hyaloraphidium curvatum]